MGYQLEVAAQLGVYKDVVYALKIGKPELANRIIKNAWKEVFDGKRKFKEVTPYGR